MVNPRVGFWLVGCLAAVSLLAWAGASPLLDPDESRFARTSVEMLRSGDPVVPHFEGRPRLVKPPLIHWIQSFLFRWLGASEWVARLHAAGATLGSMLLVAWVCRQRFGEFAAWWGALVFITSPLVLVVGRVGNLDALLAVHVFAVVALDMAGGKVDGGALRALTVGGLLGLAFLAKGPVGVVLPMLVVLAGRTASGQEVLPRTAALLQGLAAWSVVVLPWGLAFLGRVGSGTALETLRSEVLERYYAGTTHVEPFWYYAKVLAVGFLPWVAPLVVALVRTWQLRGSPVSRTARYAAGGLVAGLVFLSLSKSKLPTYILPLAPLAAILVTWELGQQIRAPRERALGSTLLAATLGAAAILFGLAGWFQLDGPAATAATAGAALYGVAAIAALQGAIHRRPLQVFASAGLASAAFLLVGVATLFPTLGDSRSAAGLIDRVPELRSDRPLVTVEIKVPSLTFYLDRAPQVLEMDQLESRLGQPDDALYVLADVDLPQVPPGALDRLREIGRHGKFRVFRKSAAD